MCFHFSPVPFRDPIPQHMFLSFIDHHLFFQSSQELLSLTSIAVWTLVVIAIVLLKLYCLDIHKESVLIVKDLGIQYTKSCVLGQQTSQFIEHHNIVDVLINEVITMHQVVCYLTLLISERNQDQPGRNQQLLPLFTATVPNLVTIKTMYHRMQKILGR